MRRLFLLTFLFLSSGASLQAAFDSADAQQQREVAVQRITPAGTDVAADEQIVIQFNRPMVALGEMARSPDELPVGIEPAVDCEWRWLDTSALACRLQQDAPLRPATRYTVRVSAAFAASDGERLGEEVRHRFVTERPQVEHVGFHYWQAPTRPVLRVTFNLPVTRASVERVLSFAPEDGEIVPVATGEITPGRGDEPGRALALPGEDDFILGAPVTSEAEQEDARLRWLIVPERPLPADMEVRLGVEPGLETPVGSLSGEARRAALRFRTFPAPRFVGVRCRSTDNDVIEIEADAADDESDPACSPLKPVYLAFSSPVVTSEVRDHARFTPDLAGGRDDFRPWAGRRDRSQRRSPVHGHGLYFVRLPTSLQARQAYRVRIDPELADAFGRPLEQEASLAFRTGARPPHLEIVHSHAVVESQVDSELPIAITNLDALDLRYSGLTADGPIRDASGSIPLHDVEDVAYYRSLGLRDRLEGMSGAIAGSYLPQPSLPGRGVPLFFAQSTPYNVHAKLGHFNSRIWVTDMGTGEAVTNARVDVLRGTYGELDALGEPLASGHTDSRGVAALPGREELDPALDYRYTYGWRAERLFVRVVRGDDMALLPLDRQYRTAFDYGRIDIEKRYGHLESWGTTAQGVYRAGREIEYKIYVRNDGERRLEPAPDGPYTLRVEGPDGDVVHESEDVHLDRFGSVTGRFDVPRSAPVGWYRFRLDPTFIADEDLHRGPLTPMRVLVAEFTPSPFGVEVGFDGERVEAGDAVAVDTAARMHAGGPYADARVTVRLEPQRFRARDPVLDDFRFDTDAGDDATETVYQVEARVDDRGRLRTGFRMPDTDVVYGRLEAEGAVGDDRGKYVAGFARAAYAGRDRYVGLRRHGWLLQAGEEAAVDVAVADAAGRAVADAAVDVVVERGELVAARVKSAGNAYTRRFEREWHTVDECEVTTEQTPVPCPFTADAAGRYRITARVTDSAGRVHETRLQQWATGRDYVLWSDDSDKRLEIVPQAEAYAVGDTARYLVKNPYPGALALVTVERNGIIDERVQRLEGSTPVVEVPVQPDHTPGFHVSVTVASPRQDDPPEGGEGADLEGVDLGRPSYRIGHARTEVRDRHKLIDTQVETARAKYQPGERVHVRVAARARAGDGDEPIQLAVAVVDEAVFDLIQAGEGYFDPYAGFYGLGDADVVDFNLLQRLVGLQDFEKKGANPGGDGGKGPNIDARRIEQFIAHWAPAVEVGADGTAELDFEAPDNLTGWRVLAIAATPTDRFGLGQTTFRVNQPTEVRPVMPNQVAPGDRFEAGFSVMNRTDRQRRIDLGWDIDGPATVEDAGPEQITLEPFERRTVVRRLQATGPGELRLLLSAGDDDDGDTLAHTLPVERLDPPIASATYGTTEAARLRERVEYPEAIDPHAGGLELMLSPSVIGNIDGAFRHARDYDYRSWESLLSRAVLAQRYLRLRDHLGDELAWPGSETLPGDVLAQAGRYQTSNGGMAYFAARKRHASPYLSAYTALAFGWLEAAGHTIPPSVRSDLNDYLERLLRKDVLPDFYGRGMAATVRAVALAALAGDGRLERADLERYRPHVQRMSLFGKAHYLRAALAIADTDAIRREVAEAILGHAVASGGKYAFNERLDDGYARLIATSMRTNCAILGAFTAYGEHPAGAALVGDVPYRMVRAITQGRGNRDHWQNTQENVFCTSALVDYARVYEDTGPDMTVHAELDDAPLGQARFEAMDDPAMQLDRPMRPEDAGSQRELTLRKEGPGRYYYGLRLAYRPEDPSVAAIDSGMEIRREYSVRDDDGDGWKLLTSPMELDRGQAVRVDVYLHLPTARHFVVIDDPVPGGLEPVNRQLATASRVDADAGEFEAAGGSWYLRYDDWVHYHSSRWSFRHRELRHAAARFYADYLPPGNYHVSYTAQAIVPGRFTVPATHAEEMYDPDVFGAGEPGSLRVHPGAP